MDTLDISAGETLVYEFAPPQAAAPTFVFVNALTGSIAHWEHALIGPALRAKGFGTLAWNFRGQEGTSFGPESPLGPRQIVEDLVRVVAHCAPPRPIYVGLSIGGLFAAQAISKGAPASGLVLVNTLRKPTLRLDWINKAVATLSAIGGGRLVGEALAPVLLNPDQLAAMRPTAFAPQPYEPMDPSNGLYRLMQGSLETDWAYPWSSLAVPTLVMTGPHDRLFRVAEDVDELARSIAGVEMVEIADAGHMIPVERPGPFAAELERFAAKLG
ncbi:MAG: alpha/beta fold hydrolase [Hyphomicrobiaceae bacterium]